MNKIIKDLINNKNIDINKNPIDSENIHIAIENFIYDNRYTNLHELIKLLIYSRLEYDGQFIENALDRHYISTLIKKLDPTNIDHYTEFIYFYQIISNHIPFYERYDYIEPYISNQLIYQDSLLYNYISYRLTDISINSDIYNCIKASYSILNIINQIFEEKDNIIDELFYQHFSANMENKINTDSIYNIYHNLPDKSLYIFTYFLENYDIPMKTKEYIYNLYNMDILKFITIDCDSYTKKLNNIEQRFLNVVYKDIEDNYDNLYYLLVNMCGVFVSDNSFNINNFKSYKKFYNLISEIYTIKNISRETIKSNIELFNDPEMLIRDIILDRDRFINRNDKKNLIENFLEYHKKLEPIMSDKETFKFLKEHKDIINSDLYNFFNISNNGYKHIFYIQNRDMFLKYILNDINREINKDIEKEI